MKKSELRVAVQEMDTHQFGLKNELHNKLTKVTSYVPKKEVIDLINQLEEPELPVIPQFVAEVIEKYKEHDCSLGELLASVEHANIKYYHNMKKYRVDFNNLYKPGVDLCAIIARAWLDGYEVEKQSKYLVKVNDQGSWLYLKSMSLYKDVERRTDLNSNLEAWKEKAIKFNNKEQAEGIAKFFGGEIEEITK